MRTMPLVCVGVPVYNGEKFIERALTALLNQQHSNIKVIISDNCSTDATENICKYFATKDKRVSYMRQQKNIGIADNFRFVLKQSTGAYFMWAAADDSWDENFIKKLVDKLEDDDSFAVAQSATKLVSEEDSSVIGFVRFDGVKNPEKVSLFGMTKKLVSPHKYNYYIYGVFRRALLSEAFKFVPSVPSSDRWFLLQLPLAGYRFAYVDEPLYIRTIATDPVYVRYKDDEYTSRVKQIEGTWFRFSALPAIKHMFSISTLLPEKSGMIVTVVLCQVFVGRVKLGFRLMLRSMLINYCPKVLLQYIRRRRRVRAVRF